MNDVSGERRPRGSGRPRVKEIAELARVSVGTVDRALNGRKEINESTRERVLAIARSLGYQPNWAARALKTGYGRFRIGVCLPQEAHFYGQMRDGIGDEAARLAPFGFEVLDRPVPRLGVGEVAAFRSLLSQRVQAVILAPGDPVRLRGWIDRAEMESGVRVVCVATDVAASARSTVVAMPPRQTGVLAGELMGKLLRSDSRVAVFAGMLKVEVQAGNVQGFCEMFPRECPGGRIVEVIEDHEREDESYHKCLQLLRRRPDLDGIYVSTANGLPVCRALEETGCARRVRLIATDLFPELAPFLESGTVAASIYQRSEEQGRASLHLLADHFLRGACLPPHYYLEPMIVMRSNLRSFGAVAGAPATPAASVAATLP